jgi:hypothetical protein
MAVEARDIEKQMRNLRFMSRLLDPHARGENENRASLYNYIAD